MNPDIKFIEDLDKKVIASALPKEITKELAGGVERNWKILTVPKDMDALMAIKFKQADAALVAENSLESFKKIDPTDSQNINSVFTTKSIFIHSLPIPCSCARRNEISTWQKKSFYLNLRTNFEL